MELKHAIPLSLVLFTACEREQMNDCVTSTGPERAEERMVGAFTAIELNDRIDLVIEPRTSGSISVEAGRNLLGQLVTEVKDGTLIVRNEMTCNWIRSFKPRITVHVPIGGLQRLILKGTGNVSSTDTIRSDHLQVEQWEGEGSTTLLLHTLTTDIAMHTGAGALTLSGFTNAAYLYSGIMAPIDASGLQADNVTVNNSGVADIRCHADQDLNVQLLDAGDVYYSGTPATITTLITGSGRLIPME